MIWILIRAWNGSFLSWSCTRLTIWWIIRINFFRIRFCHRSGSRLLLWRIIWIGWNLSLLLCSSWRHLIIRIWRGILSSVYFNNCCFLFNLLVWIWIWIRSVSNINFCCWLLWLNIIWITRRNILYLFVWSCWLFNWLVRFWRCTSFLCFWWCCLLTSWCFLITVWSWTTTNVDFLFGVCSSNLCFRVIWIWWLIFYSFVLCCCWFWLFILITWSIHNFSFYISNRSSGRCFVIIFITAYISRRLYPGLSYSFRRGLIVIRRLYDLGFNSLIL